MGRVIGSNNCIVPHRFPHDLDPLSIMARGGVASTNGRPQQSGRKNTRVRHLRLERPVSVLFEREFWLRFHIPDSIPIQLTNDEAMSSANLPSNMMYFTKEQFTTGLCLAIPSLFKQFLHFTQIPLVFIHLNFVRVLMGCSVLDMLFQLDFYLLEVLFIYTVKMSKKERFGLFSHILSLQLVTDLPDSCKGWAKGHVLVSGPWSGSSEGPDKVFSPQRSLEILSRICLCHFLCIL